jgi:hypothetical protein
MEAGNLGRKEAYTMLGFNPGMVLPGGRALKQEPIMNYLRLLSNGNRLHSNAESHTKA